MAAQDLDVIGVDEAQFFDDQLPSVCDELAHRGIRVIVAGLDMDYLSNPFGPMPAILAKADFVTKLHAICVKCGNIANYTYRKVPNEEQVMLGAMDVYEPRCRICFNKKD
jgi:thymidine kinase